jgi:glutamate synthase (NADPH/NADH) small chain
MADPKGFLQYTRETPAYQPPEERVNHFGEFEQPFPESKSREQATRCMDCGVPFCHNGCPLGNQIPAFNEAVSDGKWRKAYDILSRTNDFPEFTGRICPAPCEAACVLGINQPPVSIEHIEKRIAERAFDEGWVQPQPPQQRSGRRVAIIGSGPAGLNAAVRLNRLGHKVVVYERDAAPGGLLRYGIPDFKLSKQVLDRRLEVMQAEGIQFVCGMEVGKDIESASLRRYYDALLICTGCTVPRDMKHTPGRELAGIHPAMEFLTAQNEAIERGRSVPEYLHAGGKDVVIIGGGDTGADCVGTANRQGARSVTQLELLPKPPEDRPVHTPWPLWPATLRTSTSHEEGCEREWSLATKAFLGSERVEAVEVARLHWHEKEDGSRHFEEAGEPIRQPAQMVLLAMGFTQTEPTVPVSLGVEFNQKGLVGKKNYLTNIKGVFAAGDARRGQSLVVWAQQEGRDAAKSVHAYLMATVS